MGQKINPNGLRLGINQNWRSLWYADPRNYADTLLEDIKLRKVIENCEEASAADISRIDITRHSQKISILVHVARPGVIIGSKGANIEAISKKLSKVTDKKIQLKIKEIKDPDGDAQLVALNVASQLKKRGSFRRALKGAVSKAEKAGVQGIKIKISGRLGGAEMSRSEQHKTGRIPLHTLRANIDYGFAEAQTTFGTIGVKVWVCNGEKKESDERGDAGRLVKRSRQMKEIG